MDAIIKTLQSQRRTLQTELNKVDAALAALTGGGGTKRSAAKKTTRRKRRKLTAAERKAISVRMKKSWAARKRKAKQAAKTA